MTIEMAAQAQAALHEHAMRRAIELSMNGPAWGVNPQVGCVILGADGEVLAEGWHRGAGTPHAEVDALSQLGDAARGATAVVSLEPCNHTGRTGPCSEALIAAGIARVVYAVSDPGVRSSGGAERLRDAEVDVIEGVLVEEVGEAIHPWLTAMRLRRPYVTAKWGSSLDGRIAAADGTSQWITGPEARADVHRRRALADAIVVGTGTVLADDPTLTARTPDGGLYGHQPRPVVIGGRAIPVGSRLTEHPADMMQLDGDLGIILETLWDEEVRHVFIEGGPTLTSAFIAAGLVDEYLVYLAPVLLGGDRGAVTDIGVGTIADARRLDVVNTTAFGNDILVVARPTEEN